VTGQSGRAGQTGIGEKVEIFLRLASEGRLVGRDQGVPVPT
jgi:hypothetical protein